MNSPHFEKCSDPKEVHIPCKNGFAKRYQFERTALALSPECRFEFNYEPGPPEGIVISISLGGGAA